MGTLAPILREVAHDLRGLAATGGMIAALARERAITDRELLADLAVVEECLNGATGAATELVLLAQTCEAGRGPVELDPLLVEMGVRTRARLPSGVGYTGPASQPGVWVLAAHEALLGALTLLLATIAAHVPTPASLRVQVEPADSHGNVLITLTAETLESHPESSAPPVETPHPSHPFASRRTSGLVRWVVLALGGELAAEPLPHGGIRVSIVLSRPC